MKPGCSLGFSLKLLLIPLRAPAIWHNCSKHCSHKSTDFQKESPLLNSLSNQNNIALWPGFVLHFPPMACMYMKNKKTNMAVSSTRNHFVLWLHVDKLTSESNLHNVKGGKAFFLKLAEVR